MGEERWEHFAHEADMGIRGIGSTKAKAFEQAALAMTAVTTDLGGVRLSEEVQVDCEATDEEVLFVEWLNRVIFEMAVRKMLFGKFEVTLKDHHLNAVLRGEKVDRDRHQPAVEIKGATFTSLKVFQDENSHWVAQCVVDV